jgi:hypothetical protein
MTEQKLKFHRRYLNLLEEEKEVIAKRIIEFMRSCLKVYDDVHEPENQYQKRYKRYYYYFEEGSTTFNDGYYSRIYEENGKFEISDSRLFNDFDGMSGMFERFRYHIRMNGSLPHINKLIELFGNKVAAYYFDEWAKKNVVVGIILNKIVNKLKEAEENVSL